ncbi:MAG: nucleotidyltransferase domain-containing protein [Dehalococcoidia bacterium]|nr:nucleotidyltransferase domain-containing protein [Dehalococcoidia bacterium]
MDDPVLAEIVRRIVAVAAPERIILFGSRARDQHRPGSDYDVLVVKAGEYRKLTLAQEIHHGLRGVMAAVDVVVGRPEDIDEPTRKHWSVYEPAVSEGLVVYERAA